MSRKDDFKKVKMQYYNKERKCRYKYDCCSEQDIIDGDKICTFPDCVESLS